MVIGAEQDVYSAILFAPAISRIKTGFEHNRSARMALILCIVNAVMQIGVVQVLNMYNHTNRKEDIRRLVLEEDITSGWMNETLSEPKRYAEGWHDYFLPAHEKEELEEVYNITPLCHRYQGGHGHSLENSFSCMPPSLTYAYEWDHLDTNGDGIWTLEEARRNEGKLAKHGVLPKTVFRDIVFSLEMQAREGSEYNRTLYLAKGIKLAKAIPKAYFNYWKGDAMVCSLLDSALCEAAAQDGVFEQALKPGRVSANEKGIYDLDTAIHYCYYMLKPGGGCETLMPTDFRRHREQRRGRCGGRTLYRAGRYANPYNPDEAVSVVRARYHKVEAFERSTTFVYSGFLALIIMLWLVSLLSELRYLITKAEFLMVFPAISEENNGGEIMLSDTSPVRSIMDDAEDPAEQKKAIYKITGISHGHRGLMIFIFTLRVFVAFMLTQFGVRFLLVEQHYLNLVMNSLALTFILTIDNMLYELLPNDEKEEMEDCLELEFETSLPQKGWAGYSLSKECWGLFLAPIVSVGVVGWYVYFYKLPMLNIMYCACNQEGDRCMESAHHQAYWWIDYWRHTLPAAMHQIEALHLSGA